MRGNLSLNVRPVDLLAIANSAIEDMRPTIEVKGIQVELTFEDFTGQILGDSDRLRQVVSNLLFNALKFTPSGGQVQFRLYSTGNYAQLQVSDTGIGISPDFLPYIFDRFRQEDSSITRKQGGLGLGLAIARHIIELHGGTIGAFSDGEGKGATFTLQLPLLNS